MPRGEPVLFEFALPAGLNPNSIRVIPDGGAVASPSKTEWRIPNARISWRSSGAPGYWVYFDIWMAGETSQKVYQCRKISSTARNVPASAPGAIRSRSPVTSTSSSASPTCVNPPVSTKRNRIGSRSLSLFRHR